MIDEGGKNMPMVFKHVVEEGLNRTHAFFTGPTGLEHRLHLDLHWCEPCINYDGQGIDCSAFDKGKARIHYSPRVRSITAQALPRNVHAHENRKVGEREDIVPSTEL